MLLLLLLVVVLKRMRRFEGNLRARLERQFFNFMAKILWQNFP
jgi:hypothetical protein